MKLVLLIDHSNWNSFCRLNENQIQGQRLKAACGDHVGSHIILDLVITILFQQIYNAISSPEDTYEQRIPIKNVKIHPQYNVG